MTKALICPPQKPDLAKGFARLSMTIHAAKKMQKYKRPQKKKSILKKKKSTKELAEKELERTVSLKRYW